MKKILVILAMAALIPIAWSQIYERTDANGNASFSDQPFKGAKPMKLEPTSISTENNSQPKADDLAKKPLLPKALKKDEKKEAEKAKPETPAFIGYKSLKLTSPINEQTFQNQRDLPVTLELDPKLQPGDMVQLVVDGTPFGKPVASLSLNVYNLDRGKHTLAARVISNKKMVMITSNSVVVYIHYAHIGR